MVEMLFLTVTALKKNNIFTLNKIQNSFIHISQNFSPLYFLAINIFVVLLQLNLERRQFIMTKKKRIQKEKKENELKEIIQAKEDYKKIKSEMSSKSKDELIAEKFVCENIINKNAYYLNQTRLSIIFSFLALFVNVYYFIANLTNEKGGLSETIQIILLGIAVAAAFAMYLFDKYNNKRMEKNNYFRLKIQIIDELLEEK